MAGMDGFEALTNLRADGRTAGIPVVLLTARQQEAVLKGFSCGASDYITKPFNPVEVTARPRWAVPAAGESLMLSGAGTQSRAGSEES